MERVNKERRARKRLCRQLGIMNKQLRKRRVLRDYRYLDGEYVLMRT